MHYHGLRSITSLVTVVALTGCGDIGPEGTQPVTVRFAAVGALTAAPPMFATAASSFANGLVVVRGVDTLTVGEIKMTLEDIDLERTGQSVDCSDGGSSDIIDCSDYLSGPLLTQLNLDGSAVSAPITLDAPIGTFGLISFDISVPDGGDPAQLAYLEANPDMAGVSLRITGTFNGTPYSFALDLRGDQEIALSPPLDVTEETPPGGFSITVEFDIASWFLRADNTLMNPNAICSVADGCADRTTVEQNIERSIQSYSDQ